MCFPIMQVDCKVGQGDGWVRVPQDVYKAGCVYEAAQALASADSIGYPVMIKVGAVSQTTVFLCVHGGVVRRLCCGDRVFPCITTLLCFHA